MRPISNYGKVILQTDYVPGIEDSYYFLSCRRYEHERSFGWPTALGFRKRGEVIVLLYNKRVFISQHSY